uniref:Protein kinase domain-containing protein n=1 Tax=Haptolina brevifila TaxID=156173 RepID=A0A7S2MG69_9EUKA|mmetsp:Transcript_51685/g.102901  ORF Transcript_51685/g.102901 Transcript_51685/m.102901 type:complete len:152 (+) Transcript_51685:91-546(+)
MLRLLRAPSIICAASARTAPRSAVRRLCASSAMALSSASSAGAAGTARFSVSKLAAAAAASIVSVYLWQQQIPSNGSMSGWERGESREVSRSTFTRRYSLDKSLGKGAFGEVFLAYDRVTGTKVAVKVLPLYARGQSLREVSQPGSTAAPF